MTLTEQINTIFDAKRLFKLASDKAFIQLSRQINPRNLLLAIIQTLGCQSKANLADIHRNYLANKGMAIQYKLFHNQIKKEQCSEFIKGCFKLVMKHWVLRSLKLTSLTTGANFPFSEKKLHDGCSFQLHDGL
jgi:hypothetical protein